MKKTHKSKPTSKHSQKYYGVIIIVSALALMFSKVVYLITRDLINQATCPYSGGYMICGLTPGIQNFYYALFIAIGWAVVWGVTLLVSTIRYLRLEK